MLHRDLDDATEVRVVARAGSDELGLDPMSLNQTDSFLVLKPVEEWRMPNKELLLNELREELVDRFGALPEPGDSGDAA